MRTAGQRRDSHACVISQTRLQQGKFRSSSVEFRHRRAPSPALDGLVVLCSSVASLEASRRPRYPILPRLSDVWALQAFPFWEGDLGAAVRTAHQPLNTPSLSLPLGSGPMSKKRKRISRRRLAGQRVLAHVPTYNLETGAHKPVTAARRYIADGALVPPAILNVRRNEHTTDRFFWGEKGLFSAQYAEENHFLFPSLRLIVDRIGEDVLFEGLEALAADDWEEMGESEYAFV